MSVPLLILVAESAPLLSALSAGVLWASLLVAMMVGGKVWERWMVESVGGKGI